MTDGELSPTHPFHMDLADEISKLETGDVEGFVRKLAYIDEDFERARRSAFLF